MDALPETLRDAFDPERFRREGHALVDQLADYLRSVTDREGPVLPWAEPDSNLSRWAAPFTEQPGASLGELMTRVLAGSNHLHHPRYVGHQVTSPLPSSALVHLASALLNNGTAVYEMGPVSAPMERHALAWMARKAGFPAGSDGVLTSGGSVGNLTALLAARQAITGRDVWDEGLAGGRPLAILVPDETHYCVKRAAQILGLGKSGIFAIPVDDRFRLRPEALPETFATAERTGRQVFAVVASAGSTSTGAFDPLEPVAEFCRQRGLWFHVDGAHGASAVLSPKYAHLAAGIGRADSLVWDAHKMLLLPALVTAVLFRDGRRSYEAFSQRADYLLRHGTQGEWWNPAHRTLECTKRMMGLELWAALTLHGTRMFSDYVTRMFDLGRTFAAMLDDADDFELAVPPDCNIVCFRHVPDDFQDLDGHQERIRACLLAEGSFYLVQTRLRGHVHLRVTLINPLTTEADLEALLAAIRRAAVGDFPVAPGKDERSES
jgi:L-2,4-diaminobutyrate decarboxylase